MTRPSISYSSSSLIKPLGTVKSTEITVGITVMFMFHSFFFLYYYYYYYYYIAPCEFFTLALTGCLSLESEWLQVTSDLLFRSKYLSKYLDLARELTFSFPHFYSGVHRNSKIHSKTNNLFFFFFFFFLQINTWSSLQARVRWSVFLFVFFFSFVFFGGGCIFVFVFAFWEEEFSFSKQFKRDWLFHWNLGDNKFSPVSRIPQSIQDDLNNVIIIDGLDSSSSSLEFPRLFSKYLWTVPSALTTIDITFRSFFSSLPKSKYLSRFSLLFFLFFFFFFTL